MLHFFMSFFLFVSVSFGGIECHEENSSLAAACDFVSDCQNHAENHDDEEGTEKDSQCSLHCSHPSIAAVSNITFKANHILENNLMPYQFLYSGPSADSLKKPPIFS